ncbi:MAG: hypothetical protein IJE48_07390 [Clostridia bacterium]|nr:hypothetical protein [Clostridia bacterium]
MKKSKLFKKFFKIIPPFTAKMVLLALVLYLFAFLHYDWVDINKSESHDVIITNLKYGSDRQKAWATFDASGSKAYFEFESRKAAKSGDFIQLEQLANQKKIVTITYTTYKDWLRLIDFDGRKQVVDMRISDNIIFDVSVFNQRMTGNIIMWSAIATFYLGLGITRFIFYKKLKF